MTRTNRHQATALLLAALATVSTLAGLDRLATRPQGAAALAAAGNAPQIASSRPAAPRS